ncbi:MAG TPA: DUF11 domain-containing protein [Verrucomicrobiae bacterium]
MKFIFNFKMLAVLLAMIIIAGAKAEGQTAFGLSVTTPADSILVSNSLTYTITVTNLAGVSLPDMVVTNALPASVQFVSASPAGFYTTFGSTVVFDLGEFANGEIEQLSLTVQPTAAGFITNMVVVAADTITNTATTNIVTQVTNLVIQTDLGVTMTGPAQAVVTNDWMTYGVTVTNSGPSDAPGVVLTNTSPPGVILKGVSPANQTYTIASSNLIFNLGTLANGGSVNLQFTVQPTNAGVLSFSASIGAPNLLDANTNNNLDVTNITVINYPAGTLVAVTNSAQSINPQDGLTEQSILLSNTGAGDVAAARIVVIGLTNQLFNAAGTNNGNPFVDYSATLAAGHSVNLLLQFYPRGSFPFTNGQLQAFALPLPAWPAPVATATSTNINITRIVQLTNGNMLVEFPSTPGLTYTMVYSDNVLFSNAMIAPPSIVAPANEVQWIDYGPPATVSAPTNAGSRFYRVLLNQ